MKRRGFFGALTAGAAALLGRKKEPEPKTLTLTFALKIHDKDGKVTEHVYNGPCEGLEKLFEPKT